MLRAISGGESSLRGIGLADYIWWDRTGTIHVKKKSIYVMEEKIGPLVNVVPILEPITATAPGGQMRLVLNPCHYLRDPLRGENSFVVLCETRTLHNENHATNTRAVLRDVMGGDSQETWWGFKQGYRFVRKQDEPLRGEHYIAAERHLCALMDAGVMLHSAQTDDPSGEWSFKIGPRKFPQEIDSDPPSAEASSDDLVFGRYFLSKIARENGFQVEFTSCSVFYSTEDLRSPVGRTSDPHALLHAVVHRFQHSGKEPLWTPEARLGTLGLPVVQGAPKSYTFIEDRGIPAEADPYTIVSRILAALKDS